MDRPYAINAGSMIAATGAPQRQPPKGNQGSTRNPNGTIENDAQATNIAFRTPAAYQAP